MTRTADAVGSHCAAGVVVALACLQLGCSTPTQRIDAFASDHGWAKEIRDGAGYRHVVMSNAARGPTDRLHVYIEGDGSPYLDRWTVAPDPTPRRPVMLGLMALDPAPSVYVGRPCYLGLARDPPCAPADWTVDRYSEAVASSMARVIERLRSERGAVSLELYGHSGGGTLAVLIAPRLPGVARVVTLAGNLDVAAWASYHGYTPLSGSLNPVEQGQLPASIRQLHLAGSADEAVPEWLIRRSAPMLGDGEVRELQGVTHTAGWREHWRAVLEASDAPLALQCVTLP
jgi:pimeloyl-ACP methyl ester carboxylesterase